MPNVFDKFNLTGRTAVVTGGAGLLGSEFCRTLAEAGAAVAVVDINADAAAKTAEGLTGAGYKAKAIPTDITRPESIKKMVETTLSAFGRLDILVNSAALDPKFDADAASKGITPGKFEDYPLEQWNVGLSVNLTGLFLVTQACVKPMLAQGKKGSIINLLSTYTLYGPDQRLYIKEGQPQTFKPVFYTVTKAGVYGFTKYLATYYMGTKIRVNALTPHGIFNNHDETFVANYSARSVMGRMADKDEMNGALLFLASDASSYMTGSNLVVDGGWTAW
jgi:2-deoxy-D-gluconate 3-dehydrogenase